jgi:predicted metal-dependent phosphoesterase TrpH
MHFHTNHSDSPTTVASALRRAQRLGVGVAITDHNTVSGSEEALRSDSGVFIVPGIEVSAADGPHILLYFYDRGSMRDFYERHIRPFKRRSPYLAIELDTWEIIRRSEGYSCVRVAAHPYGYLLFNKGLQKCIDARYMEQEILEHFDGVEVMCGGMTRRLNDRAAALAERFLKGRTGGTDGHLLHDLGNVVTIGPSEDLDGFLGDVVERRTRIVGKEKTNVQKTVMGSVVMTKYIRYTVPSLRIHYEQNAPRVRRLFRDLTSKKR